MRAMCAMRAPLPLYYCRNPHAHTQESTARINSLDFHRTENLLVTASDDDSVHLFNTASGSWEKPLMSRKYGAHNVIFTHAPTAVVYATNKVRGPRGPLAGSEGVCRSLQPGQLCACCAAAAATAAAASAAAAFWVQQCSRRCITGTAGSANCRGKVIAGTLNLSRWLFARFQENAGAMSPQDNHALRYCSLHDNK